MWIKWKELSYILLSNGNGNLFCFAKGQTIQCLVQQFYKKGTSLLKDWSLGSEGCLSLESHKEYKWLWENTKEKTVKQPSLCLARKSSSMTKAKDRLESCSKYRPSNIFPTPIMLELVRSCIKQKVDRNSRQKSWSLVITLIDKRLKEKDSTQRTFVRVMWEESLTRPICVTIVAS